MDYSIVLEMLKWTRKIEKATIASALCNRTLYHGAPNPKGQAHYNGSWTWGFVTVTWQHPLMGLEGNCLTSQRKLLAERDISKRDTSDEEKKEKVLRKGSCFTFTSLDPGVLHSRCFITCTASKVNRIEEPEQYKSLGFTQPSMQLSRSLFESSSALHPANLIYLSASLSLEFSWDISDKKSHTQLHTKEVSSP